MYNFTQVLCQQSLPTIDKNNPDNKNNHVFPANIIQDAKAYIKT